MVIMTPWPAFREVKAIDIKREMIGSTVLDPYGVLDRQEMVAAGLTYFALGSPPLRTPVQKEIHA